MATKLYQQFPFQGPPNCTQIGIFGMQASIASGSPVSNHAEVPGNSGPVCQRHTNTRLPTHLGVQ
jgi:hypothetical protein